MNLDISTDPPTSEQNRALALAVLRRAVEDINHPDPELREDARFFFEESLWWPETPWARILDLDKARFLKGLRSKVKADYLALPPPAATPVPRHPTLEQKAEMDACVIPPPAATPVPA
jgi:hypothetical protein